MKVIIIGSSHNNTAEYYKKLGVAPSNLIIPINIIINWLNRRVHYVSSNSFRRISFRRIN